MVRDLQQLLRDNAKRPSRPVDGADLVGRADRRTRMRRAAAGVVAVMFLVVAAFGIRQAVEDSPSPEIVGQPTVPAVDGERIGSELDLVDLPQLPGRGVAVEQDGMVVLVGLDGTVHGHLAGSTLGANRAAAVRDLASPTNLLAITATVREGPGRLWVDPAAGGATTAELEVPAGAGFQVVYSRDVDSNQRQLELHHEDTVVATWPESDWWLTPDHRVVSWQTCPAGGCVNRFLDTDSMDQPRDLPAGCHVAHVLGDFSVTRICQDGHQIVSVPPSPDDSADATFDVPDGTDGQPAQATAVYDGGVVRVEHATCEIVEPMRLDTDRQVLEPLLGGERDRNPSAVPLGVTNDGDVVLHLNAAACDATADTPGIYLLDLDSGDLQLIYPVHAQTGQVAMWAPTAVTIEPPGRLPSPGDEFCDVGLNVDVSHDTDPTGTTAVVAQLTQHAQATCPLGDQLTVSVVDDDREPLDIDGTPLTAGLDGELTPQRPELIISLGWDNWCGTRHAALSITLGSYIYQSGPIEPPPCVDQDVPSTIRLVDISGPRGTPTVN